MQGLPEIARLPPKAMETREVDQAAQPKRAVDDKPACGRPGPPEPPLEQVVGENQRLVQVEHKVLEGIASPTRDHANIALRHRLDLDAVQEEVEAENLPIERLEGIVCLPVGRPRVGIARHRRASGAEQGDAERKRQGCAVHGLSPPSGAAAAGPSRAGRTKNVQVRVKKSARLSSLPMSAIPGDRESARLPKAVPVVRALNSTALAVLERNRPSSPARQRITKYMSKATPIPSKSGRLMMFAKLSGNPTATPVASVRRPARISGARTVNTSHGRRSTKNRRTTIAQSAISPAEANAP